MFFSEKRASTPLKDIKKGERPIIKCLAIDYTEYWCDKIREKIGEKGRIYSVYLYKTTCYYLCEITPSYELHFFEYIIKMDWESERDDRDDTEEEVGANVINEDIIYIHVTDVEKRSLQATIIDWNEEDDTEELEKTPEEAYEDLLEHLRGNGGCSNHLGI